MDAHAHPVSPSPAETQVSDQDQSIRVCLISLAGELFAIDLLSVGEVFEVDTITPVPNMPSVLAGVVNLRGSIIPIADLRRILDLPPGDPPAKYAVVIRHEGQHVGVLVDQVPEIRTVPAQDLHEAPSSGSQASRPFVSSILTIENRISGVVEVPTLLACMET